MLLALIFDAEVINSESESDWARHIHPKAGRVGHFKIPKSCKAFLEELVGKDASLWESIRSFINLHVQISLERFYLETPLDRPEYMKMALKLIPQEF